MLQYCSKIGFEWNGNGADCDCGLFVHAIVSDTHLRPTRSMRLDRVHVHIRAQTESQRSNIIASTYNLPNNIKSFGGRGNLHDPSRILRSTLLLVSENRDLEDVEILDSKSSEHKLGAKVNGDPSDIREVEIIATANDNDDDNGDNDALIDPILILPLATTLAIILLGLGVLYTKATNPTMDFDIDFYMALDGVREFGSSSTDSLLDPDTISAYPKLSPAEQLVGALFGPN